MQKANRQAFRKDFMEIELNVLHLRRVLHQITTTKLSLRLELP